MANENALHKCITKFMLDTCRYTKNEEYDAEVNAIRLTLGLCTQEARNDNAMIDDYFVSGSSVEMWIKPPLSCTGDIDLMFGLNSILAVPRGHTVPTDLKDCCQSSATFLYEIIDSHKPGYVYLQASGMLKKDDNGRCVVKNIENAVLFNRPNVCKLPFDQDCLRQYFNLAFQQFSNQHFFSNSFIRSIVTPDMVSQGPALKGGYNKKSANFFTHSLLSSIDLVYCLRCPVWPPHAAEWPTRNRDHDWPDPSTINLIVSRPSPCHVVGAVHPSCRQDKWMNDYQWRLSFSRAEITLLNSWTAVQQIVYHMLRFVLKREVFSETNNKHPYSTKPSTYHIKTLMLWECEQKPLSWWSSEFSLMEICSSLLHKFSDMVADKRCQHYFIGNCNLLDDFDDESSATICNKVRSFADVSVLSLWFFENYIRECAQRCPENISKLFEDFCSIDKFDRAMHAVIDWKLSTLPGERWKEHYETEKIMLSLQMVYSMDAIKTILMNTKNPQYCNSRLQDYFVAVTSLRVACIMSIHPLTGDLLEVLRMIFKPCSAATSDNASIGLESEIKTRHLATLSTVRSNALEMLHNEMSKAYLYQILDSQHEQESTYCVAHVLLAALHYKSGQYRAATDHCKQVLNQRDRDDYRLCDIRAEYLFETDEAADSVFGLIQFYQHMKRTALHGNLQHQRDCKLAFTADLLAHYLRSKCSKTHQLKYRHHLSTAIPLLSDVLLFKSLKIQLDEFTEMPDASFESDDPGSNADSMDTTLLVIMLELVALEKLITFRESMVRGLHSEQFPVINEFEVLHAYRCGLFEECLEMCRNHIDILLCTGCSQNQRVITAVPVFLSLLDGELLSLFGVVNLSHPALLLFLMQFPDSESISLLTLLLYLVCQCQKKLRSDLLYDTLQLIRYVHDDVFSANDKEYFVDRLILKMTYRSLKLYVDDSLCST